MPIFHEALYRALVAAAGKSDLLVQRTITRYGHCTFTVQEMVQACRSSGVGRHRSGAGELTGEA